MPPSTDPRQYIISLIDDISRYVVHSEMLSDSSIAGAAQALRDGLAIRWTPLRVTIDNGATELLVLLRKHHRDIIRRRRIHAGRTGRLRIGGRDLKKHGSR
jgi:hypothetical protein